MDQLHDKTIKNNIKTIKIASYETKYLILPHYLAALPLL